MYIPYVLALRIEKNLNFEDKITIFVLKFPGDLIIYPECTVNTNLFFLSKTGMTASVQEHKSKHTRG